MDNPKPQARGRGAMLLELIKQKEAGLLGAEPKRETSPPRARGRAALLQRIRESKEKQLGAQRSEAPQPAASSSRGELARVVKGIAELSTAETTSVSFAGSAGEVINATANYIFLEVEKDRGVFEYEVRFNPDVDAKSYRSKLVYEALGPLGTSRVYDGDVFLYLPSQLFEDRKEFESVIPHTSNPVTVTFIYKRKKRMGECLHLYNCLFRRIMGILLYKRMGRNYFNPDHKHIIPKHKLEVLPGFAISCDEREGGLMLCLDTQHRVIRSQTVYEMFHDLRCVAPRNFKEEAMKSIVGSCVLTKYNNQTYTIDDINWEMTPKDTFTARSGEQISFLTYYKNHYNIEVEDVDQPMLIVRSEKLVNGEKQERIVCLVPELCFLTGLTDVMRSDFKVMKDVAAFTRITPNQRVDALRTYISRVNECEEAQKVLAGWGLKLAGGTSDVRARKLNPETIFFGRDGSIGKTTDWSKAAMNCALTGPVDILTWQLYHTRRDAALAKTFVEHMVRLSGGMGCRINQPQFIVLNDDRTETYMEAMRINISKNQQVAVFICPTIRADRYSIIKKMCCVSTPIASQVVLSKTLSNPQKVRTIIHKIALQITCKLGGTLWSVSIPVSDWMVCGIDVYHGTNKQSVCGFVASINDSFTRYYSEAMFQDGELGDFFRIAFRKALQSAKNRTGNFPKKVVVFRDGVGDGQLEHSRRYEVTQFHEVLKEFNLDTSLAFVVVQKRINTRIFSVEERGYENPPAGTVVDSSITRKTLKDFFLVPQSVRQGTVNPTHYIVVHDDGETKPDHLQKLAFKMCHLYYNWSGTIRVPAPCLYAHKLAGLVGQYIKKTPSSELSDKLYYL